MSLVPELVPSIIAMVARGVMLFAVGALLLAKRIKTSISKSCNK